MKQTILGKKRDDLFYVVTEARIRLLVTADFFEAGLHIEDETEFESVIRNAVAKAIDSVRKDTIPFQDGALRIATVCIGEFTPGEPK